MFVQYCRTIFGLFSLLLLISGVSDSCAQVDQYPNSIGIYFDESANVNSLTIAAPAMAQAYLVATRCTASAGIEAWRGGVSCNVLVSAVLRGSGTNSFGNGPDFHLKFDVGLDSPLPVTNSVVLADLFVELVDGQPVWLSLESEAGGDGLYIISAGDAVFLAPSVPCSMPPCFPAWVASINTDGPVLSETNTLGDIKSLFR